MKEISWFFISFDWLINVEFFPDIASHLYPASAKYEGEETSMYIYTRISLSSLRPLCHSQRNAITMVNRFQCLDFRFRPSQLPSFSSSEKRKEIRLEGKFSPETRNESRMNVNFRETLTWANKCNV